MDTLLIGGDDMNIDLSALSDDVSNIEQIDLSGDGDQSVAITLDDVLNVTDTDNVLSITGDSGDSVDLNTQGDDAEWKLGDFDADSGTTTATGDISSDIVGGDTDTTVTLVIDQDVTVDQS